MLGQQPTPSQAENLGRHRSDGRVAHHSDSTPNSRILDGRINDDNQPPRNKPEPTLRAALFPGRDDGELAIREPDRRDVPGSLPELCRDESGGSLGIAADRPEDGPRDPDTSAGHPPTEDAGHPVSLPIETLGGHDVGGNSGGDGEGGKPSDSAVATGGQPQVASDQPQVAATGGKVLSLVQRPQVARSQPQVAATGGKIANKRLSSLPPVSGEVMETEWRVEWRTQSTHTRPLKARLWVRIGGRWQKATRDMVASGQVRHQGPLIFTIHNATATEAAKIERLGSERFKERLKEALNRRSGGGRAKAS